MSENLPYGMPSAAVEAHEGERIDARLVASARTLGVGGAS